MILNGMVQTPSSAPQALRLALYVALCVATCLPLVVAYQLPPQPTFVNQWLAGLLWSFVAALMLATGGSDPQKARRQRRAVLPWLAFWLVMCFAIGLSVLTQKTPLFVAALPIASTLLIALLVYACAMLQHATLRFCFFAMCIGLVAAAAINATIALLQVIAPHWHDDMWIAALQGERVYGNLRQPNLLALVSLFGSVAMVASFSRTRWIQFVLAPLFVLAIAASGSRAGMIGLALLMCAAAARWIGRRYAHRHREERTRARHTFMWAAVGLALTIALLVALVAIIIAYDTRVISTQHRLALWHNVATLIASEPWLGVGFGQLNFAWTLTPFSLRAPDVFDHAHNFLLQWAVEFGVPIAILLTILLAYTLYRCVRYATVSWRWSVLAMVAVALLHSTVEFPLWFLHFLLPVSTLLSLLMASQTQDAVSPKTQREMVVDRSTIRTWRYVASFAVIAAALAVSAYAWRGATQVEQIYAESRSPERAALHAKTAAAHFTMGHYGDYALIMLAGDNATLDLFGRTTRTLIDERLLLAWARAYAREGETDRAQFLFDRAREFSALRDQIAPSSNTETQPRAAASKPFGARDFRF